MTVPAPMVPAPTEPAVTVIGCDGGALPPGAAAALAGAAPGNARVAELTRLDEALSEIGSADGPAVVLASGDPGFFGIVRALRARGIRPLVLPAVSSVALAFARLGLDWDDAIVLSAHGRDPGKALAAALAHPKAAILTAPGTIRALGQELRAAGKQVYIAESLGSSRERVAAFNAAADPVDPNILISLDEQPPDEQPGE